MTTPHRNCSEIATLLKFHLNHSPGHYLSGTEDDQQAQLLPPGRLPIWVEKTLEVTYDQVLDFINENYVADTNLSVTVVQKATLPVRKSRYFSLATCS